MRLYLFRLSLKHRQQADAFERTAPDGKPFGREAWIRDRLAQQQLLATSGKRFTQKEKLRMTWPLNASTNDTTTPGAIEASIVSFVQTTRGKQWNTVR